MGLSYQSDDNPILNRNELNPKLGVQWTINDYLSLRAAAFQTVKRTPLIEQTIEPTQVTGFNQFFDDAYMTLSKNYGLGLNVRFNNQLVGGTGSGQTGSRSTGGFARISAFRNRTG
ncbi:hypothetical protein, partial [Candidatus Competibacter phosphatis]|uniref:hypothetical protein n=1 Tax=Candidatus Competibacter phosphatis TaxID=221280 RepID=UPI0028B0F5D4